MNVTPVAAPVRSQVVANLREALLTGHFAPGERLVEADLCEWLGVSRTSVREALRQLEAERLVTIVPYRGPMVATITLADADQIYEVRALLEARAARLAARRATAGQVEAMRAALDRFARAIARHDPIAWLRETDAFYEAMLAACGNRVVTELLAGLHARVSYLRVRSMSAPDRVGSSLAEMAAMQAAIAARDPAAAERAAKTHVHRAHASLRSAWATGDDARRSAAPESKGD